MKRWIVTALLCVIVLGAVLASILLTDGNDNKTPSPSPTPTPPAAPKFGTLLYIWSGYLSTDWQPPKYVDFPVQELGNYTSTDPIVIEKQLRLIEKAGFDFVIISWWGDKYGNFMDEAARQVLQTAQNMTSKLKFAIMVEPFNLTGSAYDLGGWSYNYSRIYENIWRNYVSFYTELWYNMSNKPLICFFNDGNLTRDKGNIQLDDKFHVIMVGQQSYAQWMHTDLNKYDTLRHELFRQISVTPRYDDSRIRYSSVTVDPTYEQGVYDEEWANATRLWQEGKINIILINSWNEYPERTAIEPHYDYTAVHPYNDPYYLYNKTKEYINDIRQQAAK